MNFVYVRTYDVSYTGRSHTNIPNLMPLHATQEPCALTTVYTCLPAAMLVSALT